MAEVRRPTIAYNQVQPVGQLCSACTSSGSRDYMERNDYPSRRKREIQAEKGNDYSDDDYDPFPSNGPLKSENGWVLFVSNVNMTGLRESDLRELFEEFGRVQSVTMNQVRSQAIAGNDPPTVGYALVEFQKRTEAQDAINRLHGLPFKNKMLDVTWAYVKQPPSGES
jgi:RNA recognition motif-containing protein